MRIAVTTCGTGRAGGVEAYLGDLIPRLRMAGHEVALLTERDDRALEPAIRLAHDTPHWCAELLGRGAALSHLKAWQPDVVFGHGLGDPRFEKETAQVSASVFFAHAYFGACISGAKLWKFPSPTPCSRAFGPACLFYYYPRRCGGLSPLTLGKDFRRQSLRLDVLKSYHAILTFSRHMMEEYQKYGFADKLHRLPPLFWKEPHKEPTPRRQAGWRLLYLGRFQTLKGGTVLLDALPSVVGRLKVPIELIFAGDGPQEKTWKQWALRRLSSLGNLRWKFLPWQDRRELTRTLERTDLLIVPSLWPEPFGLVGIEALSHGVPVASFAVGAIPEWLIDGKSGHLATTHASAPALADAIIRCLADPQHHEELRQGALQVARELRAQDHLTALMDIFHRVRAACPLAGVQGMSSLNCTTIRRN